MNYMKKAPAVPLTFKTILSAKNNEKLTRQSIVVIMYVMLTHLMNKIHMCNFYDVVILIISHQNILTHFCTSLLSFVF